ncbi:phytanoyl-CoA dioxygenase family protein [Cyclobacterium plantarum]|uniref:Phytanoyl-CoA dioxygenase family protein n=1 Tax=Cyclobacterium plantarum TaxID=2716263 RepID=A0ABX0HF03_9BACT|nr:phytanoyl-CoA dioxygenase family protein [Cyclobacterium plantarum]NHE58762.1 phytanoyl-CoA dioxygenase family protein [Cyclobacterium plantarum]
MAINKNHKDIPGNPSTATSSKVFLNDRSNGRPLKVLTENDWDFWVDNGYVIIKNAVPKSLTNRLRNLLWEFEEKNPKDPETWYGEERPEMKMKELTNSGMVEIYNHQYLWDIRQYPKVYETFTDIWGMDELWVTIDRANLNLPARPDFEFKGFIHWDYDPETNPQNVQGLVALNEQTDPNVGGFQCIPELYRNYETWKTSQPADRDRFKPDISGFELTKVKLDEGDLLIFNSKLPHGIRPNISRDKVRMAQYISMMPAENENQELRDWRISSWKNRIAPDGYAFPGDPRNWEQTKYKTAILSPLGRKLLGLDPWYITRSTSK